MLVIWLKSSIKFPFVVSKSLINYLFIEIIHQIYENENIFLLVEQFIGNGNNLSLHKQFLMFV